jgi:hypothetical protein
MSADLPKPTMRYTNWPSTHPGQPMPKRLRSLQKLEKVR